MKLQGRRIIGFFPIFNTGEAVSYTAGSIYSAFAKRGVNARLWVPASHPSARRPYIREAIPNPFHRIAYRAFGPASTRRFAEKRFLRALRPGDVAHVWPGFSSTMFESIKDRGAILVLEKINCALSMTKEILDREAAAIEAPPSAITLEGIEDEKRQHEMADLIFAPNDRVYDSLLAEGIAAENIIRCGFGWDPNRIRRTSPPPDRKPDEGLRVLFAGSGCVRKGIHRLLEAWNRAEVKGKLLIAGRVDPFIWERYGEELRRPNVELLGFVGDMSSVFDSADVFAFPSFEEGGPLVTYEAMGAGLPLLVSPMGAAGIARDGIEAVILPPDDVDAWADALKRLAADPDLRARMSRNCLEQSARFTFDETAGARLEELAARIAFLQSDRLRHSNTDAVATPPRTGTFTTFQT